MPYVKGLPAGLPAPEGDARGHFGIGRTAHGSDPDAVYVFEAPRAALPPDPLFQPAPTPQLFRYETEIDAEHRFTRIKVIGALAENCSQLQLTMRGCSDAKSSDQLEADLLPILKRIVRDLQQRCDERLSAPPL